MFSITKLASPSLQINTALLCHTNKIKGQIPHVGAGLAFSAPWYLAFPVKQVSVCILNGSNFNRRFALTGKKMRALLISALG